VISAGTTPRLLLIEPPGRVRAASATHEALAGGSVEEALGVDWATLEALARTTQRVEAVYGRIRLEPLLGQRGEIQAVLATEDTAAPPQTITSIPPPSSSRWGKVLSTMVGKDPATRAAVDLALRFARTNLPVMITAEEGCGADVLARAMHAASSQSAGPMVHVPLGTIPKSAIDPILFNGHPHSATSGMLFVEDVQELDVEQGNASRRRSTAARSPTPTSSAARPSTCASASRGARSPASSWRSCGARP
jgi:transcriptional regulator of acetoin/glycerol metabolism